MTKHLIHDKILHIRNINNEISKSNIAFITIQNKSTQVYVCFVLLSFVCISAYAHAYFKTTTIKQKHKNNTNYCGLIRIYLDVPNTFVSPHIHFNTLRTLRICMFDNLNTLATYK